MHVCNACFNELVENVGDVCAACRLTKPRGINRATSPYWHNQIDYKLLVEEAKQARGLEFSPAMAKLMQRHEQTIEEMQRITRNLYGDDGSAAPVEKRPLWDRIKDAWLVLRGKAEIE
jgi:hypothetical protein